MHQTNQPALHEIENSFIPPMRLLWILSQKGENKCKYKYILRAAFGGYRVYPCLHFV